MLWVPAVAGMTRMVGRVLNRKNGLSSCLPAFEVAMGLGGFA